MRSVEGTHGAGGAGGDVCIAIEAAATLVRRGCALTIGCLGQSLTGMGHACVTPGSQALDLASLNVLLACSIYVSSGETHGAQQCRERQADGEEGVGHGGMLPLVMCRS